MNILYCGDSHIERGLLLSLLSLCRNDGSPLAVYVLTMQLTVEGKTFLPVQPHAISLAASMLKRHNPASTIRLIDLTTPFANELPTANLTTRFTPYCMLRLWADHVTELPDRLLYMDTDVVCLRPCAHFYEQNMEGVEYVAVPDFYGKWLFGKPWHERNYVNSGVMLMNLRLMRTTHLLARCRHQCRYVHMFMPDQTALNEQATHKRLAQRRYNEQRRTHADTVLRHFSTTWRLLPLPHTVTVKPWDTARLHHLLHCHDLDPLLAEYQDTTHDLDPLPAKHQETSTN